MPLEQAWSRHDSQRDFAKRFQQAFRSRLDGLAFGIACKQPGKGFLLLRQGE